MSVDISVSITEDVVDIIATPTVNIVNVTNSASINPGLYDLSQFTNTSINPFVRTSGLSAYVPTTRTISTTAPLTGGGNLSADRTLSIPKATTLVDGYLSAADWTIFNGKQNALGFTPVPTTRTLTINGTTQDLSADRTFTISTGITIGTTAITSGTVGRVLFEGTGNVVQESANLFWDNTNGRLGIGTSTPAYDLELRGARFYHTGKTTTATTTIYSIQDNTSTVNYSSLICGIDIDGSTIGLNISGSYLSAGTSGTGALRPLIIHHFNNQPIIFANNNAERMRLDGSGNLLLGATNISSARGGVGTKQLIKFGASQQYLELQANTTSTTAGLLFSDASTGNFGLVNYTNTDNMEFYTAAAERMRIFSTGNVGVNTTTDAGFKLDVNGTARVSGPSTYSMVYDSNGILNLNGTYARLDLFNQSGSLRARLNCDGPNGTLTLYQNAAGYIFLNGAQSGNNSYISTALSIGNQSAANASSILEVSSTTKGFLCPRMTTTQKNAIATPATGLMVYDTTLNLISVYNGTTWITL